MKEAGSLLLESGRLWMRPVKFIILTTYIQIHSCFKSNYDVQWPENLSTAMNSLSVFNLDLLQVG